MHHQHVLRYFACWIEGGEDFQPELRSADLKSRDETGQDWIESSTKDLGGISLHSDSLFQGDVFTSSRYDLASSENNHFNNDNLLEVHSFPSISHITTGLADLVPSNEMNLKNPADPSLGNTYNDISMYIGNNMSVHIGNNASVLGEPIRNEIVKASGNNASVLGERIRSQETKLPVINRTPVYLYIQTGFCEKTLHAAIDEEGRNTNIVDSNINWRRFRQIAEGLNHIHHHGIIHRDLKPGNIFIESVTGLSFLFYLYYTRRY